MKNKNGSDSNAPKNRTQLLSNDYLINGSKQKCRNIWLKDAIDENEMVDFLVFLHIILESSLNAIFREHAIEKLKKNVNKFEVIENLDKISFIDKTVLFIYNSDFDFTNDLEEAGIHHRIIGHLRNFSGVRNLLLHGHSISSLHNSDGTETLSKARKLLNRETMESQVELFKQICDGITFFIVHLSDKNHAEMLMTSSQEYYLGYSFLRRD